MVVVRHPRENRRLLGLDFSKVARPVNYIVFILIIEYELGVDEVLNDLLTTTILEELRPCCVDIVAFDVVVGQGVVVH